MFHLYRWRERLRDGFQQLRDGQRVTPPPEAIDELNDRELAEASGISLDEAAMQSEATLRRLIELWQALGDRPFKWYIANTTAEALVRNSYFHPRNHIAEHFIERGDRPRGYRLYEETAAELGKAEAPGHILGPALYNLSCVRVAEGRHDEALALLAKAMPMRDDMRAAAATDPDLKALRSDPRFQALL